MSVLSLRSPFFPSAPRRDTSQPVDNSLAKHRVASELLLGGGRELLIRHQRSQYHLRLNRNDKLILTT